MTLLCYDHVFVIHIVKVLFVRLSFHRGLFIIHCAKKPVTTMLTYPWKCTVLHCNHLGNTWKPLVLMT